MMCACAGDQAAKGPKGLAWGCLRTHAPLTTAPYAPLPMYCRPVSCSSTSVMVDTATCTDAPARGLRGLEGALVLGALDELGDKGTGGSSVKEPKEG